MQFILLAVSFLGDYLASSRKLPFFGHLLNSIYICLPTVFEVVLMAHCFCFTNSQSLKQFMSPYISFSAFLLQQDYASYLGEGGLTWLSIFCRGCWTYFSHFYRTVFQMVCRLSGKPRQEASVDRFHVVITCSVYSLRLRNFAVFSHFIKFEI